MTRIMMIAGALVAGLWLAACDEPADTTSQPGQTTPAPSGGTTTPSQ